MWTFRQIVGMMAFVGITTGFLLLILRFTAFFFTSNRFYLYILPYHFNRFHRDYGYTSINPIVMAVIMGLRQLYPDRSIDTHIPFITGNLEIPFQVSSISFNYDLQMLPQLYLGAYYIICFVLELGGEYYDFRLPFAMYFSWFYLRFIMVNPRGQNSGEVGDSSVHFALHTFAPEAYKERVAEFSDSIFVWINTTTGAFDYLQRKYKSPLQNTNHVDRKK